MSETHTPQIFRLGPNIAHEPFEDEHIVVNLESGTYYALEGEAADVWSLAVAGLDGPGIAEQMSRAYSGDPASIASAVSAFLERLAAEALLVPERPAATSATGVAIPARHRAFKTPDFERHNDLQDLLLLDPVHEVDSSGWPTMRKDQTDDQS